MSSFWHRRPWRNSDWVTHYTGTKYGWGRSKSVIYYQYVAISQKQCKIGT